MYVRRCISVYIYRVNPYSNRLGPHPSTAKRSLALAQRPPIPGVPYMYVYMYVCRCISAYMYIYIYIYICMCVFTLYMYAYMHTHARAHAPSDIDLDIYRLDLYIPSARHILTLHKLSTERHAQPRVNPSTAKRSLALAQRPPLAGPPYTYVYMYVYRRIRVYIYIGLTPTRTGLSRTHPPPSNRSPSHSGCPYQVRVC